MKVKILGTRGQIEAKKPYHTKHSGILINDELLIDLGEKEYLDYDPKAIVFTHLHPDHAYFLENEELPEINIPLYVPEHHYKIPDGTVKTGPFETEGYNLTPIPTIHSLKVISQGYVIEKDSIRIFCSGDMAWIEKKHYDKLENMDMVITEGSFIKKGGMIRRDKNTGKIYGHTGVPDLVRVFSKFTGKITFMHFGSWFMKDVKKARKKVKSLEPFDTGLIVAYDGMEIEV